jgi:hypothetical protein
MLNVASLALERLQRPGLFLYWVCSHHEEGVKLRREVTVDGGSLP